MDGNRLAAVMVLLVTVASVCIIAPVEPVQGLDGRYYHNAKLHVNVTKPGGSPGIDMRVIARNYYYQYTWYDPLSYTDSAGVATFELEPAYWGPVEVKVYNSEYTALAKARTFIEPGKVQYLDVVTEPPLLNLSKVSGTVTNASNKQRLGGVEIGIQTFDHLGNSINRYATTAPNGNYEIAFPNVTGQVNVYANLPGHVGPATSFASSADILTYDMDLELMVYPPMPRSLNVRYINSTTGEAIDEGGMSYNGYYSHLDHSQAGMNYFNPDTDGWFDIDIGPGEFYTTFMVTDYEMNYSVKAEMGVYVNGSDITMEVPVEVPELKLLEVNVWNSTSPLEWANAYYEEIVIVDGTRFSWIGSATTDSLGRCFVGIRSDRPTQVTIYHYDHYDKVVTVDPDSVPLMINVTLEEYNFGGGGYDDGTGTVRISLVDKVTGYTVPGTIRVLAEGYMNTYVTNQTGVYEGDMYALFYQSMEATTSLGFGSIRNVTIAKGSNPDMTIEIDRVEPYEDTSKKYHFYTVDEEGEPVSGVPLIVTSENPYSYISIVSDSTGKVEFQSGAKAVYIYIQDLSPFDRPDQAIGYGTKMTLNGVGGAIADLKVYPASPLDPIYGFVKDARTGELLKYSSVSSQSLKVMSGHSGNLPSNSLDDVQLFWMNSYSDTKGFYRVWGRDDVFISASMDGYFPKYERVTMGATRAETKMDILLDPMPEFDIFVNGTMVDGAGNPIQGYITPSDKDHDMFVPTTIVTGTDGKFSMSLYKGNFSLKFGNLTLIDYYDLEVTGLIEDLVLRLIPRSNLIVTLEDWKGDIVPGIEVELERKVGDLFVPDRTGITSDEGTVQFRLPEGTYRIVVPRSPLYDPLTPEQFEMDGSTDKELTLTLLNRTTSDITGTVTGSGGPHFEGVPWTRVALLSSTNETIKETKTGLLGTFSMLEVPYGTYSLVVEPPENLTYVLNESSGYIPFGPEEFVIGSPSIVKDIELEYRVLSAPEYLIVTEVYPTGTDVALNAPIIIRFSRTIDRSTVPDSISIDPEPPGLNISYQRMDSVIRIEHGPFSANTTYHVHILSTLLSAEGYPMMDPMGYRWNFTTGDRMVTWEIFSADVRVGPDKLVEVNVTALGGIDIYIVVADVGSFLLNEITEGNYWAEIPGSNFEWNTTYSYHFSNVSGGADLAPSFHGTFKTPKQPWSITSFTIEIDDDLKWHVDVVAPPGLDIFIIIEDVGSFKLDEVFPGSYSVIIDGDNFEEGGTYYFYFSDREDGAVLAPGGSRDLPEEEEEDEEWALIPLAALCCIVSAIFLIVVIVILVLALRRKKGDFEE